MTEAYSAAEMMIVAAARRLPDGARVLVGVGQPNLACNLALRLHAPRLVMIYEAGVIGARPNRLPLSIGDPVLASGALQIVSMFDLFGSYLQRGLIDIGFLGGAQIDRHGNLNSTVIGPYERPNVRLPGSGGACEIALHARDVLILMPQTRRRFPPAVDFITSPGFAISRDERARRGYGGGPRALITDLGVYEFDGDGEMVLVSLHPGVTLDQAQAQTGWPLRVAERIATTTRPTPDELRVLRSLAL
jgi:glutaconate CoA-transferase subunit B